MVYQCKEFDKKKCMMSAKCVIKSTFIPSHIWKRNSVVVLMETNGIPLDIQCNEFNKQVTAELVKN